MWDVVVSVNVFKIAGILNFFYNLLVQITNLLRFIVAFVGFIFFFVGNVFSFFIIKCLFGFIFVPYRSPIDPVAHWVSIFIVESVGFLVVADRETRGSQV